MICHNLQRSTALARLTYFQRPERNGDNRLTSNRVFVPVVDDYNFNTFNSLNNLVAHLTTPPDDVNDPVSEILDHCRQGL